MEVASAPPEWGVSERTLPQPQPPVPPEPANENRPRWNRANRILFRFAFVYFILYILPFPVMNIISDEPVKGFYQKLQDAVVLWVGPHVLNTEVKIYRPTGSGDTTYDYVLMFSLACVSAAVTAVWSLLDRKRLAHPWLFQGLRVYVRFYLASMMLSYGAVKVIQSQFPSPALDTLVQPLGNASPMGILWSFMGASRAYNFFAGAGEMIGGLLLTTRRTTLLGALVTIGVMSNVAALNYFYDVPVKLFSSHLLLMAFFLVAPDLRRLADLLVLHRPVSAVEYRPFLGRWKWLRYGALTLRTLVVVGFTGTLLFAAQDGRKKYGDLSPRSPFYGIWNVEELETDGKPRPPLVTDEDRWRRVIFEFPKVISIQVMSDSRQRYGLELDQEKKTFTIMSRRDTTNWSSDFTYSQPEDGVLVMEGTFEGKKVKARLRHVDEPSFLLKNRGFHWINEYPYNR